MLDANQWSRLLRIALIATTSRANDTTYANRRLSIDRDTAYVTAPSTPHQTKNMAFAEQRQEKGRWLLHLHKCVAPDIDRR